MSPLLRHSPALGLCPGRAAISVGQVILTAGHAACALRLCMASSVLHVLCEYCMLFSLAHAQSLALFQAEHIEAGADLSSMPRGQEAHADAGLMLIPAVMFAANIPPYAVGGALLIVGALMVANVAKIPWDRIGQVQ